MCPSGVVVMMGEVIETYETAVTVRDAKGQAAKMWLIIAAATKS